MSSTILNLFTFSLVLLLQLAKVLQVEQEETATVLQEEQELTVLLFMVEPEGGVEILLLPALVEQVELILVVVEEEQVVMGL
jgi:hypothetical protein